VSRRPLTFSLTFRWSFAWGGRKGEGEKRKGRKGGRGMWGGDRFASSAVARMFLPSFTVLFTNQKKKGKRGGRGKEKKKKEGRKTAVPGWPVLDHSSPQCTPVVLRRGKEKKEGGGREKKKKRKYDKVNNVVYVRTACVPRPGVPLFLEKEKKKKKKKEGERGKKGPQATTKHGASKHRLALRESS